MHVNLDVLHLVNAHCTMSQATHGLSAETFESLLPRVNQLLELVRASAISSDPLAENQITANVRDCVHGPRLMD
jgi:hypothetical protein